jgi:hypothetical protein
VRVGASLIRCAWACFLGERKTGRGERRRTDGPRRDEVRGLDEGRCCIGVYDLCSQRPALLEGGHRYELGYAGRRAWCISTRTSARGARECARCGWVAFPSPLVGLGNGGPCLAREMQHVVVLRASIRAVELDVRLCACAPLSSCPRRARCTNRIVWHRPPEARRKGGDGDCGFCVSGVLWGGTRGCRRIRRWRWTGFDVYVTGRCELSVFPPPSIVLFLCRNFNSSAEFLRTLTCLLG